MSNLQWFRLYHRIIDDEKIRLIAFEDRWHFIAVCCLKADGLLDEPESPLKWRKVAVKLGIQARELDEIKRRLFEVGLVDENLQPMAWDELQYRSDTSTDRVRKYREKTKGNTDETPRNVSVTAQETEADTETDSSSLRSEPRVRASSEFDQFWDAYPNKVGKRSAEQSFIRARKRVSQADLMAGLVAYTGKADDRPWCNPATWLNQDRWSDRPAQVPIRGGPAAGHAPSQADVFAFIGAQISDDPRQKPDDSHGARQALPHLLTGSARR